MCPFDTVYTQDDLTSAIFIRIPYVSSYPDYIPKPQPSEAIDLGERLIGRKRVTQCNRGKREKFKPGKTIKNAPILHQEFACKCPTANAVCYSTIGGKVYKVRDVTGPFGVYATSLNTSLSPFVPFDQRATEALVQATAKTKSAQADLGVMLGEARETLGMLAQPFTVLPKLLRKLRRPKTLRRPSLGSAAQYASDAWLQYRYGIRPLLSDIDTVRNLVNNGLSEETPFSRERASIQTVISQTNGTIKGVATYGGCYCFGSLYVKTIQRVSSTCYFRGALSGGAALGVDVTSIPNLVWELTPYSFVIDWFVDVGSWLSAISPKPGITLLDNCVSTLTRQTGFGILDYVAAVPTPTTQTPISPLNATIEWQRSSYMRDVGWTLPSLPVVNISLESWKRRLDGISLLYQRARRSLG